MCLHIQINYRYWLLISFNYYNHNTNEDFLDLLSKINNFNKLSLINFQLFSSQSFMGKITCKN